MTNPTTPAAPPGWYADPAGGARSRWWDGTQWTENFQEPYSTAAAAAALTAPDGTRVNTVWIWLIVFLPVIPLLSLFTINWNGMFQGDASDPSSVLAAEAAVVGSPGYVLATLGGWVLYGLCGLFAYLDWRQLKSFGVPRPFPFAWVFLSSIVYVIGRSVVARRRTGRGIAPMWAAIGTIVLSLIVSIVIFTMMVGSILAATPSLH